MLGQRFATILARTDPFDVAQGVERHVRTLGAQDVRALIASAQPRMNGSYRKEFVPLLAERDDARLKEAFAHSLKSNLRAIPLFGPQFCEGVIAHIPGDRTIGLGDEAYQPRRLHPAVWAAAALVLLLVGAGAQHAWSTAHANAETPVVLSTPPPPVSLATAAPVRAPHRRHRTTAAAPARRTPAPPAATQTAPPAAPVAAPPAAVAVAAPADRRPLRTPPPGRGARTVVVAPPPPTPTPVPTPIDVTDMPRTYSDATPLPKAATPPPAVVPEAVAARTPTPAPRRRSWIHRTIMHLDPFKPHPTSTPSAKGPQPQ